MRLFRYGWLASVCLLVMLSASVDAHQQQYNYTNILFNPRSGNLEISHRISLHDAEHGFNAIAGKKANLVGNQQDQAALADYIVESFAIANGEGEIKLNRVGHEVDGQFFWVYQETPIQNFDALKVKHTAFQSVWPTHINQINLERGKAVASVQTSKQDDWYDIALPLPKAQQAFFDSLSSMCGERFEGAMTYPESGQDSFAGKTLVAHIQTCDDDEIRIPFTVGEDKSRTWILRLTSAGLQLKHDHRHKDGSLDEITDYGGTAFENGTALQQAFPADAHTAELIPEAATNVWQLSFDEESDQLTYHLTRHGKPRFTALLFKSE